MKLVVNASPLIFLAKIDLIQVLPDIVDCLVIPKAVTKEIAKHKDKASQWLENNIEQFQM
ncbi:MAG: hypothetical protein K9H64_05450 [Bacteroidales bacterium]|nr:hypothetical protein [Bacteroidales bacterium]MCF8455746.1 hypothetical protein [Bacteroidales bacterium]